MPGKWNPIKEWEKDLTDISTKKTYRWLTNTWKDAQYHSWLEKCKSKPQWEITSNQSEWASSKSLQAINTGEGVEKREYACSVGGNVNWYSHYRRWYAAAAAKSLQSCPKMVWRFLKKLRIKPPYDPAIPLLGICPEETKTEKTHVSHCSLQHYLQ